jgi:hypothetical protein
MPGCCAGCSALQTAGISRELDEADHLALAQRAGFVVREDGRVLHSPPESQKPGNFQAWFCT